METLNLNAVSRPAESRPSSPAPAVTRAIPNTAKSVRQDDAFGGINLPQQSVPNDANTDQQVRESVSELNEFVQSIQRSIQFSVNETTGQTVISVKDTVTGEEIRTIPSEELLAIAEYIAETLAVSEEAGRGVLLNIQA